MDALSHLLATELMSVRSGNDIACAGLMAQNTRSQKDQQYGAQIRPPKVLRQAGDRLCLAEVLRQTDGKKGKCTKKKKGCDSDEIYSLHSGFVVYDSV